VAKPSVLLIGDANRREFRAALSSLRRGGLPIVVPDVEAAAAKLGQGLAPELVVLAQAFPGQFSQAEVDRLRRLAPLARILGLLGSWCEGEPRTGRVWPGVARIYWHQWLPRADEELARMHQGIRTTWGLPDTATDEERLLLDADTATSRHENTRRRGLLAIFTYRFEMSDWLSAACRTRGYSTTWLRPAQPRSGCAARAAIFDGNEASETEVEELRQLQRDFGPVPIIALLDFPRTSACRKMLAAGATAVLSKPLRLEDLYLQLDRVFSETSEEPTQQGGS